MDMTREQAMDPANNRQPIIGGDPAALYATGFRWGRHNANPRMTVKLPAPGAHHPPAFRLGYADATAQARA